MLEKQNGIENVEIEPLSDDDLAGVAGGTESSISSGENCCSLRHCSNVEEPAPPP